MNELIRRTGGGRGVGKPHASAGPTPDIGGRALNDTSWNGAILELPDAGLSVDTTASVASAVTDESGVRRRPDGTYYRLRIGWVAYPSTILVSRCMQELRRGQDGKLHTVGPYVPTGPDRYDAVAPASHRQGVVPGDPPLPPGAAGQSDSPAGSDHQKMEKTFQRGFETLAFLPSKVRRGVLARLKSPTLFTGHAIQYNDGDRYELAVLGLYESGAVVVSATTHRDTTSWNTSQFVYEWPRDYGQLASGGGRPTLPRA